MYGQDMLYNLSRPAPPPGHDRVPASRASESMGTFLSGAGLVGLVGLLTPGYLPRLQLDIRYPVVRMVH